MSSPQASRSQLPPGVSRGLPQSPSARLTPKALNALGVAADTAAAAQVLKRFDSDGTGKLNLDQFRRLVLEVNSFRAGQPTHGD